MAQLKVGDKVGGVVPGKVSSILTNGWVRIEGDDGEIYDAHVTQLQSGVRSMLQATENVMGLLPDPPAAMARLARKTGYPVLPSPMAPETDKSGIVPDGLVKYLGKDGFLHVVPGASTESTEADLSPVIIE